jgi:MYXO-CTERM domain-containing protein
LLVASPAFKEELDPPPSRWLRHVMPVPSWLMDAAIAAFLTFIVLLSTTGGGHQSPSGVALLTLAAVAVAWRRRWPAGVLLATNLAYLGDALVSRHLGPGQPAMVVALYTFAERSSWRRAVGATVGSAIVVAVAQSIESLPVVRGWGSVAALVAAAVLGASVAERRRERARERELLAAGAAAEERVRLARELHDVVAHHLSVVAVQANVLADSASANGAEQGPARAVVESSRQALAEMRRILGVLRPIGPSEQAARAPHPGLRDLRALVQRVSDAGVRVQVHTEGEQTELPAGVDLAAYRILQEALTNVLRHARATSADVRINYTPSAVRLEVTDDGIGPPTDGRTIDGHGLEGMQERAALLGGELTCGPASGRGYKIHAVLPL